MTWFRKYRRGFAVLSALVLALQALAVAAASHAKAAVADGTDLVPICTADGMRMIDLSATGPEGPAAAGTEQTPAGEHQCPLCIVGCGGCAAPLLPLLLTTVVLLLGPEPQTRSSYAVAPAARLLPLERRSSSPRGPPQLA